MRNAGCTGARILMLVSEKRLARYLCYCKYVITYIADQGAKPMAVKLNRFYHVNINVTDLDRSIAFYEALGFRITMRFSNNGEREGSARAFGMAFNPSEAAFMKLGD